MPAGEACHSFFKRPISSARPTLAPLFRRRSAVSPDAARAFIESSSFHWHQGFELAPGVQTPGRSSVDVLLSKLSLPDLGTCSVLDIGTFNGGLAFTLERLGARRVV